MKVSKIFAMITLFSFTLSAMFLCSVWFRVTIEPYGLRPIVVEAISSTLTMIILFGGIVSIGVLALRGDKKETEETDE